jgi:hypothetical protein
LTAPPEDELLELDELDELDDELELLEDVGSPPQALNSALKQAISRRFCIIANLEVIRVNGLRSQHWH